MERRSFFTAMVGEVVPRVIDAQADAKATAPLVGFDRLALSPEQALAVQTIYEQHADRYESVRTELRKLVAGQKLALVELNEPQLHEIREKMAAQRNKLHAISLARTLAICRILDDRQRQLYVDMSPARVSPLS